MIHPPSDTMAERGMVACARALAKTADAARSWPAAKALGLTSACEQTYRDSTASIATASGPNPILFTQHGPREI